MNAWLLLGITALIFAFRAYVLWRKLWNQPLDHGPEFFLGNAVPPRFYDGEGAGWLTRYRTVLIAQHAVEAAVVAAILISGRWELVPVWAGGGAVLQTLTLLGFSTYARRKLAAIRPTPGPVAVALEPRRLSRYVSWQAEGVMLAILAASWLLLLRQPDGWQTPAVFTWVILALFPLKAMVVRAGRPLPADRTAEHHRWAEAQRRHSLRVVDSMRWAWLTIFAGYALLHGWPCAQNVVWLRPAAIAAGLGASLYMMGAILRGGGRIMAMGRGLKPVASGPGIAPAGWMWMAVYFGGLAALLFWFRV